MTQVPSPSTDPSRPDGRRREGWLARLARVAGRARRLVMLVWLVTVVVAAPLALELPTDGPIEDAACRYPGGYPAD